MHSAEDGKAFANHSIRWRLLDRLLECEAAILRQWFAQPTRGGTRKGAVVFSFASHEDIRTFLATAERSQLPGNAVFVSQSHMQKRRFLGFDWQADFAQYTTQVGLLIVRVENATHAVSFTPVPQHRRSTQGYSRGCLRLFIHWS